MALKSRTQILNEEANAEGASNEAILMAALNESQAEYKRLSGQILMRLEAVEASVTASNAQKGADISAALKNASETILGDMRGIIDGYRAEVEKATADLQKARKRKEKDETADNAKWLAIAGAIIIGAFAVGGYIANYAWSAWYDVPETLSKMDAINNGIYQLLNR